MHNRLPIISRHAARFLPLGLAMLAGCSSDNSSPSVTPPPDAQLPPAKDGGPSLPDGALPPRDGGPIGPDAQPPTKDATPEAAVGKAPLHLTLTLHLENKTFNSAYFASLDAFAKLVETYKGRLTFEPRSEVVTAAAGPPVLLDWRTLEARGHAVGSHAAIGGINPTPVDQFTAQAKMRYDQLVSKVTRLDHVSGNCGNVDWVKGIVDAGFKVTTAATVMCLYSMAANDRPDPYKNLNCTGATDATCHKPYPTDAAMRIHPWRTGTSANWVAEDKTGKLVIVPGAGTLPCLEEEAVNPNKLSQCTLTQEDVTRALAELDEAIGLTDASKVNTFYWVWGSWGLTDTEKPVFENFLKEVDKRVSAGSVKWANITEMYDAYVAWEKTR